MADSGSQKPITGIGIRPDDCWALPLCNDMPHGTARHRRGDILGSVESRAKSVRDGQPALYARKDGIEAMRAVIFAAREKRK